MSLLVGTAERYPQRCAVSADSRGPFIDTLIDLDETTHQDPQSLFHIYLRADLVQQWAEEHLGMVPQTKVQELQEQIDSYKEKVDSLQQFAELKVIEDQVVRTLEPEEVAA